MFDVSSFLLPVLAALVLMTPGVIFGEPSVRIVSLAPNLTELVYDLGFGDHLVGRTSACDYPAEAESVPVVGGFGRPNLELLTSLQPDYVLVTDLENRDLLNWLQQEGVQALMLPCENWQEIFDAAQNISTMLGNPAAGNAWRERILARITEIRQEVDAFYQDRDHPRVYVEVWGDPLTTVGSNTFLNSVITLAGGRNLGQSLGDGYIHASGEWIVRENPDVIVLAYMLPNASAQGAVRKRVGWSGVKAVRENAICDGINPDLLLRPGPRLIDGVEQLAEWLRAHCEGDGAISHEVGAFH